MIVPLKLRSKILDELHKGHCGIVRMKALSRSYVWWPGLDEEISKVVKECAGCQSVHTLPAKAPLYPWAWTTSPWQRIHVYFFGPILGNMFFLVTDAHFKWPKMSIMSSTTAVHTVTVL